ncbi:MAG TPA: DUF1203 domain-containing protein [Acidobacteriota bacterium]|nr:DUF1203 domain-containing protein [Acidobacteriota bacterium]
MSVITSLKTAIYIPEIPEEFLHKVRTTGLDAQNQPVKRYRLEGEPCRDVLRRSRPGEEIILASYCPFTQEGPFKEYGPIYLLAEPSSELVQRDVMPLKQPEPEPYLREQFVLRAYSYQEEIIDAALVRNVEAQDILDSFLSRDEVAFVDARFPVYGCFACRFRRA